MLSILLQLDKCIIQYYRRFSCAQSLIASTPGDEYVQNSQLCPAVLDIVKTSKQLLQSQRCKTKERQRASVMTIHNLYIFSKTGTLLYYAEWNRLNKSGITKEEVM